MKRKIVSIVSIGDYSFAIPRNGGKTLIVDNNEKELLIDCPFDEFVDLYEFITTNKTDYDFIDYKEWSEDNVRLKDLYIVSSKEKEYNL